MISTLKQAILGFLFWIVFAPFAIATIILQPIFIVVYLFGDGNIRDWVYRTGKALDQLDNAAVFGGLPQETISSHTGRYVLSGQPLPWKFKFVVWLTNLFEQDHAVKAVEPEFKDQPL